MSENIPVNYMQSYRTLTGLTLTDALAKLTEVLPPRAYKAIGGSSLNFTDINSAYLIEYATKIFGLVGIGWWYEHTPVRVDSEEVVARSGRAYTNYLAFIDNLNLVYVYVTPDGEFKQSVPVGSSGGSDNEVREYAARGALTNALGAAFSKLCWQIQVYKGILTHENAREKFDDQRKRNQGTVAAPEELQQDAVVQEQEPVKTKEPMPAPKKENPAPAPKKEEPAKPVPTAPKTPEPVTTPEPAPAPVAVADDISLEEALKVVIPVSAGIPRKGEPLQAVVTDQIFGEKNDNPVVRYLAGKAPRQNGQFFEPQTDEDRLVQNAALVVLADYETRKAAEKKKGKKSA